MGLKVFWITPPTRKLIFWNGTLRTNKLYQNYDMYVVYVQDKLQIKIGRMLVGP